MRRLVAFALFGDDVEEHRLVLVLQKLEGLDQQRDVVAIDRTVIAQAEFLEDARSGTSRFFTPSSTLCAKCAARFADDLFDESARLVVQMRRRSGWWRCVLK